MELTNEKYPLNLIKDVFNLHNDPSLALSDNAANISDKCLEKIDDFDYSLGYILRRRYKDGEIIRIIADEVDRSRAVVYARIRKALSSLSYDPDFRDAFTTDKTLPNPFPSNTQKGFSETFGTFSGFVV